MICKRLLLLVIVLFFTLISESQDLEFYGEDLTFEIFDSMFQVNGTYYLCNVGNKAINQILFYPFPVDSQYYGDINSIRISKKDTIIKITRQDKSGVYFGLKLKPYKTVEYEIFYNQRLLKNKADYILETTKKWKKPFETADYKLIIPDNLVIDYISYEPDSILTENSKLIYLWHKKDFMPDRNMIIEFNHK